MRPKPEILLGFSIKVKDIQKLYIKQQYAKKKTLSKKQREKIRTLNELGYSYDKISKMMNTTKMTVYFVMNPDKYEKHKEYVRKKKKEKYKDVESRNALKEKHKKLYRRKQLLYVENKLTNVKGE